MVTAGAGVVALGVVGVGVGVLGAGVGVVGLGVGFVVLVGVGVGFGDDAGLDDDGRASVAVGLTTALVPDELTAGCADRETCGLLLAEPCVYAGVSDGEPSRSDGDTAWLVPGVSP